MTATSHRGKEWFFRHLLHLGGPRDLSRSWGRSEHHAVGAAPRPIHFLRRMKEDLVDYDGKTRLFKTRTAANFGIPLSALEFGFYKAALRRRGSVLPAGRPAPGAHGLPAAAPSAAPTSTAGQANHGLGRSCRHHDAISPPAVEWPKHGAPGPVRLSGERAGDQLPPILPLGEVDLLPPLHLD